MKLAALLMGLLLLAGCRYTPDGIKPVEGFDIDRYLGSWYEIARLDHRFERGLSRVTATYSRRQDGGINVVNRGFKEQTGEWKEAKGRGYFVGEPTVARLKVTFFWPFYGGYNVIALDRAGYRYALVCGPNRGYLWILSRTPQLENNIIEDLIKTAGSLGFDTDRLLFVEQQD